MIMEKTTASDIQDNYARVLEQVRIAAESVNRDPDSIRLVVVTKGHLSEKVLRAVSAGIRLFGENYVEEAVEKIDALRKNPGLEWHMIGHVQSRKARLVCENFSFLHSLDSLKLARRLDRFADQQNLSLSVFLECNVSGEQSKFGFSVWDQSLWPIFIEEIKGIMDLNHLRVSGLMTMAPFFDDPELARPYFRRLRELRDFLSTKIPENSCEHLSMGMSGDFQVAVQEGATYLRIGTAIMGARAQQRTGVL